MAHERAQHAGTKFTITLPADHSDKANALKDAVRAAGFGFAPALSDAPDAAELQLVADDLTGLLNRNAGLDRLRELWALSRRHGEPLSCLLISVDQVRTINDQYGVAAGDDVLREMTRLLRTFARTEELVCRLDGNEFLVICPKSTARNAAIGAERHRWAVQSSGFAWESMTIHITVSIGVAERNDAMTSMDQLVAAATRAVKAARLNGGNRVHVAGHSAAALDGELLHAAMSAHPDAADTQPQHLATRVLLLSGDHDDPTSLCSTLSRWGFAPHALTMSAFDPAMLRTDESTVVVALIGSTPSDWAPAIRTIRAAASSRMMPIVLLGEANLESEAQELIHEGANVFASTDDPPRVLKQLISTMAQSQSLAHQLTENQAMRAEQARMLTALFDLARAFASADTLERCLDRLLNIACELLRAKHVAILVTNRDRSGMSLARVTGETVRLEDTDTAVLNAGVIGQACRQRETMLIASLDGYSEQFSEIDRSLIIEAPAAITPMVTSQRVVGVLVACANSCSDGFKPWEVAMLDLLSNIAAASIDDHHARTARDEAREAIVVALAKLTQHRDGPTAEHVDRVSRICVTLARDLANAAHEAFPEIDDAFITNLEWAVPLHDIGKVGLPDSILLKPGRLTDEEMEIMRSHVTIGQSALHSVSMRVPEAEYLRMAEQIAHAHHEWYDGTGYPTGIAGEDIPLAARIAAVADVYDAITSSRCYKKPVAHATACEEISARAGTQFDPRVVKAFERCKHMFAAIIGQDDGLHSQDHADAA